jgi:hypothetical protein
LFEPAEHCFTGGVREWSLQNRLARAGRLTNEHDIAEDGAAGHGRRLHSGTAPAPEQLRDVLRQRELLPLCGRSFQNRRKIENKTLKTMLRMMQVTIGK